MIDGKLEELRRSLVDLTRNNRLLNHRSKGQRSLALHGASVDEVYRRLVTDRLVLQFLAREEAPTGIRAVLPDDPDSKSTTVAEPSPTAGEELPLAPAASSKSSDFDHLQTLLSGEKLQTRLVDLAREAHSAIEEQGCNLLYCTFGMVEWCEAEQSSVLSRAPLIFVPVEMKRKSVNTRYAMQMFDDEIVVNSSLIELCQAQFQLTLPNFDVEAESPSGFFNAMDETLRGMRGWRLVREVNVGLYSFTKLQMYRDLDPKNWPDATKLTSHPLINALTGTREEREGDYAELPRAADLDELLKPADCFQVVDADSSQQVAIMAAKRGINMVIDGPPGTGKSQTITNIIGECLADGKTILFVSEKSAALEVVKRRLSQVGLADFVLELHSRQGSKKVVIDEINRVLEKQAASKKTSDHTAEELERSRQSLNRYARDLHEPFGEMAISPFEAMSRAIGLTKHPETTAEIPNVAGWTFRQLTDGLEQLDTLDRHLARVGSPSKHPWRGTSLPTVGLREKQLVLRCCEVLVRSIAQCLKASGNLSRLLGKPAPQTLNAVMECVSWARSITLVPPAVVGVLRDDRWSTGDNGFNTWLDLGQEWQAHDEKWRGTLKPDTYIADWNGLRDRRIRQKNSILRFLYPSWRSDGKRISAATATGILPPIQAQLELLDALVKGKHLRSQIENGAESFGTRFGRAFSGAASDWKVLAKFASDAVAARALLARNICSPDRLEKLLVDPERQQLITAIVETESATSELQTAWKKWLASIGSSEKQWLKADFSACNLSEISRRVTELHPQIDTLQDYNELRTIFQRFANTALRPFVT